MLEENVLLEEVNNRFLSEDIYSTSDFPPFNRSAMDGYAVMFSDIKNGVERFNLINRIFAGDHKISKVKSGDTVKIMTGAPVPPPFDCVIMVEYSIEKDGVVEFSRLPKKKWDNIALKGEDLKKGKKIFKTGHFIRSNDINLLGSNGFWKIPVYKKLNIGVISTGNEIVHISENISAGKIRNSSLYSLKSQIEKTSVFYDYKMVKDELSSLKKRVLSSLTKMHIILITGGSSRGDKDYTLKVLEDIGAELIFERIQIKPGRPTIFAKYNNKFIFGLPGNPVSTFTVFKLFVEPFIHYMNGDVKFQVQELYGVSNFSMRKKTDRPHYIPVQLVNKDNATFLEKIDYHGSGDFTALSKANAMAFIPKEQSSTIPGMKLKFFLLK